MRTRLRYRTEASARKILRQRWKTALRHNRIPAGTQFRTQAEDLGVNPENTTMTRALFLVNDDGQAFPGLRGGVPFTPPRRKRQKTEPPARNVAAPPDLGPDADEGSPIGAPPPLAASAADEGTDSDELSSLAERQPPRVDADS